MIYKKNNYFYKKPPKKFGGFIFLSYICSVIKNKKTMWNKLIKVIKNDKVDMKDKDYATLLLGQLNTAGGKELLKNEVERFINDIDEKYALGIK